MKMDLRTLTPPELAEIYRTHLCRAFPPEELKSLAAMEGLRNRGQYDPLGAFDGDGELEGLALLWRHPEGKCVLLDYLCVPEGRRNGGIGGRLMQAVLDYCPPGTVLLAEAEAPAGNAAEDGLILRRLEFYRRCGGVRLGYQCGLFGVRFAVLCWGEPLPPESEIMKLHRELYLRHFGEERFCRYIQLPLAPGEELLPPVSWQELTD